MERLRSLMFEMNAAYQGKRAALDYGHGAACDVTLVVKPAKNSDRTRTRQRRVQLSTRRSSSLERCWTALPVAPAGTRSVKSPGALLPATHLTTSRFDGPVRFG